MRKDYSPIIATALRLITKYGEDAIYYELDHGADDAVQPWDGVADPVATGTPTTLQTVWVPPAKVRSYGITTLATDADIQGFVNFYDKIGIVAPAGNDMSKFSVVTVAGREYGMDRLATLEPASTPIIAFVGTRR